MTYTDKSGSSANTSPLNWQWWPVALVSIGLVPLVYWHLVGLLNKPHYAFLYLLPIAIWLLFLTLDESAALRVSRSEAIIGSVILITAACALGFATTVWSPWIATVAFLISMPGLLIGLGGWRRFRQWFPMWAFLWILIPLPFGMDEDLIVRLRDVTTEWSSSVLDLLGILHNRSANVIDLPGKSLFIADACSGIHSLYVLLAASLLLAALFHRGIMHTMLLLVSTVCVVLIENVARIVLVAVLWRSGRDFSMGLRHEVLGTGLFLASLLFLMSLDQLWLFFCSTRKFSLLTWLYEKLSGDSEKYAARFLNRPGAGVLNKAVLAVAAIFPVLAVGQLAMMPSRPPRIMDNTFDDFELPQLSAATLPETLMGFQRQGYKQVARVPGDPLGQASQQWRYANADGTITALISIDYPYSGVHDLCECYDAIGWQIDDRKVLTADQVAVQFPDLARGPIALGHLNRSLYGHGLLVFHLDDASGRTSAVIKDLARGNTTDRAARRMQSFADNDTPLKPSGSLPYIQFQLFARTARPITVEQERQLLELFLEAGRQLRDRIAQKSSDVADRPHGKVSA